ncbi:hypothetical protein GUJ93_ZPchr0008g11737 [Zizania palustris]|uniref:Alpha/beta hydrolase fold-3 domain-containing protein n=1 Tax=Zizania palustris TaxID=103762 RepID=A0A8J5RIL5_ZIZPA|nr:hypothetical protein GUJ93_ZPchr0008g11737 [Zizania palustris]
MTMRVAEEGLAHGAKIRGLVMIHPYFLGTNKVCSEKLDPAVRESLRSLWCVMCPTTTGDDDPLINPFVDSAPGLESLACGRVLVCIGEGDVLRDRGHAYYDRLTASGWRGEAEIWQAPGKGTRSTSSSRTATRPSSRTRSSATSSIVDSDGDGWRLASVITY